MQTGKQYSVTFRSHYSLALNLVPLVNLHANAGRHALNCIVYNTWAIGHIPLNPILDDDEYIHHYIKSIIHEPAINYLTLVCIDE